MTDLKSLIEECEFDPESIGIKILESLGYKVKVYADMYRSSIFVYDKDDKEKLVYWRS